MLDKLDTALRLQQETLNLRAQRQGILTTNIANTDTPGYQMRDLDFTNELKKVMVRGQGETGGVSLTLIPIQHVLAQTVFVPSTELLYRIPDQPPLDGSTISMDREYTQFADNSLKYQTGLTALGGQTRGTMNVLQGEN